MTYTQLTVLVAAAAILTDLAVLRTRLLGRRIFWVSYAIILFFQLVTNGVLTGLKVVQYNGSEIIGSDSVSFFGDGRIFFAPVEDVLFGFCLVLLTLSLWAWLGRSGVQREPVAGPPRWRR